MITPPLKIQSGYSLTIINFAQLPLQTFFFSLRDKKKHFSRKNKYETFNRFALL